MMGRELFLIEMRGMDETAAFAMGSVILEYILWLAVAAALFYGAVYALDRICKEVKKRKKK